MIRCQNCCKYFNCKNSGKSNCEDYVADERLFYFNFSKPKPLIVLGRADDSESRCYRIRPAVSILSIISVLTIYLAIAFLCIK